MSKPLASIALGAALAAPNMAWAAEVATNENAPSVEAKFLVAISEPGTYRLTGNLVVLDANTTAIEVNADDVIIDMNGFSIRGLGTCTAPPVSCSPRGTGNGIHAINRSNIIVRNGAIYGMGNVGIYLETNSGRVEKVQLSGNAGGGIVMFGGEVINSVVENNGGDGIMGVDILLEKSLVRDNQQSGFKAYATSSYANSAFSGNNNNAVQVDSHPTQGGGNLCSATVCP